MMYEPEIMIAEDILGLRNQDAMVHIYDWNFGRVNEAAWETKGEVVRLKLDVDVTCSVEVEDGFAKGELKGEIQIKDYATSVMLD